MKRKTEAEPNKSKKVKTTRGVKNTGDEAKKESDEGSRTLLVFLEDSLTQVLQLLQGSLNTTEKLR
jgi:hypothetical protein